MGGGDLNLKKSWHPNTMKNIERVWKAEQKDTEEKKRIAELQKEIIAERSKEDLQKHGEESGVLKKKDEVKLEWMYKGPSQSVNHEEYLLGKAVDKSFEQSQLEKKCVQSTSFGGGTSSAPDVQVDMARKLVEDPLEVIRRRAIEKAKELYNNPIKLKKIQKMVALQSESGSKCKKEKKEKKKKKKKSKSHKRNSSDSGDGSNLDALLTAKLRKVLKDKDILKRLKEEAASSSESDSDTSARDSSQKSSRIESKGSDACSTMPGQNLSAHCRKRSRSRSLERVRRYDFDSHSRKKYVDITDSKDRERSSPSRTSRKRVSGSETPRKRRKYSSSSESEHEHKKNTSDDGSSKQRRTFGLMMPDGSKPVAKVASATIEQKSQLETKQPPKWEKKERVKLTEEEKERRRQEMLHNASWRDKEREATVKRYRKEEARERSMHERDFDKNFAMKQFSKATQDASIAGRIKSKLNTIQRSEMSMDKNFARR